MRGNLTFVKSIIECGWDKDVRNNSDRNPLMIASFYGKIKVVKYLISMKVYLESKDYIGNTPLILASWKGHQEVVRCLISNGAERNNQNWAGRYPLDYAELEKRFDVVKYLISIGAKKKGDLIKVKGDAFIFWSDRVLLIKSYYVFPSGEFQKKWSASVCKKKLEKKIL